MPLAAASRHPLSLCLADAAAAMAAAVVKRGPEYLAAVDLRQRPLVAFINRPRAKIPRVNRCACAGLRMGGGGSSRRLVQSLRLLCRRPPSCLPGGPSFLLGSTPRPTPCCLSLLPSCHPTCRRQTVLNKLAGEQLALAAGRRRPLLRPAAAAADEKLR